MITRILRRGGRPLPLTHDAGSSLLDVVNRSLGVRSASKGCDDGSCGACRVLLDGRLVNACGVRFEDVRDGAEIETYEDVAGEPAAVRAVEAFSGERPTRCSLCVGGLGVTAVALEREGKSGDEGAIEQSLATAKCMCTGRGSLRRALLRGG